MFEQLNETEAPDIERLCQGVSPKPKNCPWIFREV
jgi:hypothetical protein